MAEVLGLARRVDPHARVELDRARRRRARRARAASAGGPPPSAIASARPVIENVSSPVSPSEAALSPSRNCSGSTPMPIRFERWMRSKLSAITARTPSSFVPLAAQSREEPVPYSLPASTTRSMPCLDVAHGGVVDRQLLVRAIGEVVGVAALRQRLQPGHVAAEQVAQADVRERAAHHHLVVAAAGAVRVEVARRDALLLQVQAGRARRA